jgi:hypothetical protein
MKNTILCKTYAFLLGILFSPLLVAQNQSVVFETTDMKMVIDGKGYLQGFYDKSDNVNYLASGKQVPLLSIRCDKEFELPSLMKAQGSFLVLLFEKNKIEAKVKVTNRKTYLTFELVEMSPAGKADLIVWGPYATTIRESIGEVIGVVHNDKFSLGIQCLNMKTLGGYPTEESDVEPYFEITDTVAASRHLEEWKVSKTYRGQTAKWESWGSLLQAYCRNRDRERIVSNWEHEYYVAPPFNDGGVIGSKIALFGCPPGKVLDMIGQIEITEGLPHPLIDGTWCKIAPAATSSYLILDFDESTIDEALKLTSKAGLKYLYHGGPFLVSVFTSLTGIDAFYWFNASSYTYDPNPYYYWTNLQGGQHPLNRWTISIPGQMAMFPANAVIFRKGYIEEEDTSLIEFRTKESILDRNIPEISEEISFDPNRDEYLPSTGETPFSPLTYLTGKVIVNYSASKDSSCQSPLLAGSVDYNHKKVKNLSGTVEWDYGKGVCTVNTPYFQGLCGFPEPGHEYSFSDLTISTRNEYIAVSIVSLDGEPLGSSGKILVQTGTVYRPSGWLETPSTFDNRGEITEGFLIQNTGTMPWQAEKTNATIKINNNVIMRAVRLNETGYYDKAIMIINSPVGKIITLPPNAMYTILDDTPSAINNLPEENDDFVIFPNPASDKLQLIIKNRELMNARLEIIDTAGRKVYEQKINNPDSIEIDSGNFRSGIYFALIRSESLVSSCRFVIK